jgi:TonB family protein
VADSVHAPELKKFLEQNIKCPMAIFEAEAAGRVSLSFKINNDGAIKDIIILNAIPAGYGCDQAVLRALKQFRGSLKLTPNVYTISVVFDSSERTGYDAWAERKVLKNFLFGAAILYRPVVIKRVTVN